MHKRELVTQPADPSYRLIPLTRGQVCKVDAADYDWLMQWTWRAIPRKNSDSFYAARGESTIYMHKCLLDVQKPDVVDHKNCQILKRSMFRVAIAVHAVHSNETNGYTRVHT